MNKAAQRLIAPRIYQLLLAFQAIESFLLPGTATGVSLLAVWRRIGATPQGSCGHPPCPSRMRRRAERTAESGIVHFSCALSGSPRAP